VSSLVSGERRGAAFLVRFTREAKLNAISGQMEAELCELLASAELRESACVLFTGSDRVFSAGADVTEFSGLDPAAIMSYYYDRTGDWVERVADLPQPTIAAVSGYCLGAGFELALACDFRIADETAVFGLPEVALGILPSSGGTYRLVRLLGPARAKELILLRDRFDASQALRLGAVTEVVSPGAALDRALEHAERLAGLPQLAVRVTGRAVDAMAESSRATALELERVAYGMLGQSPEADQALKPWSK
jgi:enoyl-CoA hydratase/carnithine racemase